MERDEMFQMRARVSTKCLQQSFVNAFNLYSNRPCFGRIVDSKVVYSTYQHEWQRITTLTRALMTVVNPCEFIAISFEGSRLWYDVELAVMLVRCVSAGISHTWSASDWTNVVNRANVTVAFADVNVIQSICNNDVTSLSQLVPSLRTLILITLDDHDIESFDAPTITSSPLASTADVQVMSFTEFLSRAQMIDASKAVVMGEPTDNVVVLFSSGSTGTPKGAV